MDQPQELKPEWISKYRIPAETFNTKRPISVGGCVYGRYPGIFVYIVFGELEAYGLQDDGSWAKYGHNFDSHQEAWEALQTATIPDQWKRY